MGRLPTMLSMAGGSGTTVCVEPCCVVADGADAAMPTPALRLTPAAGVRQLQPEPLVPHGCICLEGVRPLA